MSHISPWSNSATCDAVGSFEGCLAIWMSYDGYAPRTNRSAALLRFRYNSPLAASQVVFLGANQWT